MEAELSDHQSDKSKELTPHRKKIKRNNSFKEESSADFEGGNNRGKQLSSNRNLNLNPGTSRSRGGANSPFQGSNNTSQQPPTQRKLMGNDLNKSANSVSKSQHAQAKKKAESKKLQRYESASIDEEEFQDYFTNPVKRKEFDQRRKRQQVKEIHNITQFTLGNFGIKDKKALKEALPPYPDADEHQVVDSSKNYATVSLCCMSVTNPFRNKIIHLVALNPWFDRIILGVITINCIFLALDEEVDVVTKNGKVIDNVFLVIYTLEMILKIIAQGFVMRPYSYLRDGWNILDFTVVVLGWTALAVDGADNISAIKVIRILRPLRTINQIPKMPSLVATIMKSLPIMFDVMVLFLFMMVMFGTIATQLLGGALEKRCTQIRDGKPTIELGPDQVTIMCRRDVDCTDQQPAGVNSTCQYHGNPIDGTFSFDNILLSMMNIFQIITLEGWTDMMYIVRDTERTFAYDALFLLCVVLGSFVILNLMVAVQASYLDQAFEEEEQQQKAREEKLEAKRRMTAQMQEDDEPEGDGVQEEEYEDNQEETPSGSGVRKSKQKKKGCCHCEPPQWYRTSSVKMKEKADSPRFERTIVVLILVNTFFMSVEHYDQPGWVTKIADIANLFFTVIFAVEMVFKLFAYGLKEYFSQGFNVFDCFIVIMSFVELMSAGDSASLSVLRAFRLLRIFKIIKSWKSLRRLLATVLESLTAITNLAILIFLYLFISALLTKQFYSGELLDSDGELSRYRFSSTGDALVSVFIILTGENWNEIMVQVIVQQKSFSPALLFIIIVVLGNWMLLNLFLAILLKALSKEPGGEEQDPAAAAAPVKDGEDANEENGEFQDDQERVDDASNNQGNQEPSAALDSSNSNIEAEFEIIKAELEKISRGLHLNNDGAQLDQSAEAGRRAENGDDDQRDREGSEVSSQSLSSRSSGGRPKGKAQKITQAKGGKKTAATNSGKAAKANPLFASEQKAEEEEEAWRKEKSLYLFSHDNKFRAALNQFICNSYFSGFIYHMIALNSLLLMLDAPELTDGYQKKTIGNLLLLISIIFIVECLLKVMAFGFYFGHKTYLKDGWNILDFVIVLFSLPTIAFEFMPGVVGDVGFMRGFRALRALRPLKFVSKNEGIKTVVNALLESIPSLLNVLLIVLLFLLVFGILGMQLFMGRLGYCNDSTIDWKKDCIGNYTIQKYHQNMTLYDVSTARQWETPFNNYDNVAYSMITFFEIATLEMWPGLMYAAVDSVALDHGPRRDNNPGIAFIYVVYIFLTTFFIMNLFISVIVDKFNDEIKKRQGSDQFTDEQKEWVKIQRLLVHTNPKIIPVEPINCLRLQCFKIVQSQAFEYIVLTAIVINTAFMCVDHYGQSKDLEELLANSNFFFVIFFTIEMVLKLTAYGFKYYWYVNWNKFDFIVVILSLVAIDERFLQEQFNFNVTSLRIIRITRLLRMVKTSQGLRTLLKTLFMSIQNILNTALLLFLILFTFSVAGMSLFASVPEGDYINKNVNFTSFYLSFMTLWRAATGESWNGIMHDCYYAEGFVSVAFWLLFQLCAFFIFMNVFIAVIGESFNDNQATEDENDILALKKKDIKAFQNTWAKFNPMGELYMRTIRLPDFLRALPPPLGYLGIRIEDSKLNKIIFCLNIRDHLGKVYYPEVMWAIFHSIAGMNDEKVLNCEQIRNILKVVKMKYKRLGKKVNLDQLCGNKYYRKDLTAVKYIQAIKILNRWKAFKNHKIKMQENQERQELMERQQLGPGHGRRANEPEESPAGPEKQSQVLQDRVNTQDIRLQRVQNIGRQIQDRRDQDRHQRYEGDDGPYGGEEPFYEADRTRRMGYMNEAEFDQRLDINQHSLEESYDGNDLAGERNAGSARSPDARNKYLRDQRGANNGSQQDRGRGGGGGRRRY